MNISDQELELFSRQLILKEFNNKIFKAIQKKHIVIVGIGGIGCPAAQYLLTTGIKNLTLIDGDKVQLNNLNRQILFSVDDLNKKKVEVAKKRLSGINPNCNINIFSKKLSKKNIKKFIHKPSIVIDTSDNWSTMKLMNEFCVKNFIPLVSSSIIGYDGQVVLFKNETKNHLCLNCIFPNQKDPELPRCETVGVLGTAAGLTGLVVAQTVINFLTKQRKNLNKIVMINSKSLEMKHIKIKKNNSCLYKNL